MTRGDWAWELEIKGGPGSGHYGHAGRPGKRGGSLPGNVAVSIRTGRTARERQEAARAMGAWGPIGYRPDARVVENARRDGNKGVLESARYYNQTADQIVQVAKENIQEVIDSQPISIRRSARGAKAVLQSGRFKTQFETKRSSGWYNPELRLEAENLGLGAPKDLDVTKRPIYGYLRAQGTDPGAYGAVEFVLKEDIKDRTTITLGDSLSGFEMETMAGSPIRAIGPESWDRRVHEAVTRNWGHIAYIEAQIHGGVSLRDVEKIILHSGALYHGEPADDVYRSVVRLAGEHGIEVEFDTGTW